MLLTEMVKRIALLILIVVGIGGVLRACGVDVRDLSPERLQQFLLSFGIWAPAIYLLAYGQPLVPLPASVMTITGGLAFGPWWGTLAALTGATVRACAEFGIARLLGRAAVAKLLKGKVAALDEKLGANGFKAVLFIRLLPNLPFDVQNYGLGFSRVRFAPYALASVLGMMPGCFAFVYFGYSLTDPRQLWKLVLAVVIIAGLMWAQRLWKRRKPRIAQDGPG